MLLCSDRYVQPEDAMSHEHHQITSAAAEAIEAEFGISEATARRACRELSRLGLIRLIPGHGYYPGTRP